MIFPIQAPPVRRPDHVIDPMVLFSGIDIDYENLSGDQLMVIQMTIAFDANINDPQWFATPSAEVLKVSAWPGRR
ncbi:hypothetical protein [Saccharopolyspora sp. NPDC002376]